MNSAENLNAVLEKLKSVARNPCPLCGGREWTVPDEFYKFVGQPQLDGSVHLSGQYLPAIAVVCHTCGWIAFHNTIVLAGVPGKVENNANQEDPMK